MVLDLVVQAAEGEVGEPTTADVARSQGLPSQEAGLPCWSGAAMDLDGDCRRFLAGVNLDACIVGQRILEKYC